MAKIGSCGGLCGSKKCKNCKKCKLACTSQFPKGDLRLELCQNWCVSNRGEATPPSANIFDELMGNVVTSGDLLEGNHRDSIVEGDTPPGYGLDELQDYYEELLKVERKGDATQQLSEDNTGSNNTLLIGGGVLLLLVLVVVFIIKK